MGPLTDCCGVCPVGPCGYTALPRVFLFLEPMSRTITGGEPHTASIPGIQP